jgi:hypothetical protein
MLRLTADLADQAPVSLGQVTGIDDRNVGPLICRASRRGQFPYKAVTRKESQRPAETVGGQSGVTSCR